MDVVHRLNAELGLVQNKNDNNNHHHGSPSAATAKKLKLPAQLEQKGYKALKLIGEGAYGKALLVSTDGTTSVSDAIAKRQQQQQQARGLGHEAGGVGFVSRHSLAPSEAQPIPSLIIVKHINLSQYTRQERLASKNEIGFLKKLNHPNIIRYVDSVEDGPNDMYILMEFADCGDLEAKCKKGKRMEEKEILSLFAQIVDAVGYMHSLKVLHRDLKPQNVFMSAGGTQVKIGDFGISKALSHTRAMAHTVCGTPYYFSPELCKGKPYNAASDVWALGVMLYEMLTRKMPFDARTMTQLMAAICSGTITRRPELANDHVWSLICSMLSRDAASRPDCNAILLHPALRGLTNSATTNAHGVHVLPVPAHMSVARRHSGDLPTPLPLGPQHATPSSSHAPTPINSRNPSPTPTPRLGLADRERDRARGGGRSNGVDGASPLGESDDPLPTPAPHHQGRAPLPTPYGVGAGRQKAGLPLQNMPLSEPYTLQNLKQRRRGDGSDKKPHQGEEGQKGLAVRELPHLLPAPSRGGQHKNHHRINDRGDEAYTIDGGDTPRDARRRGSSPPRPPLIVTSPTNSSPQNQSPNNDLNDNNNNNKGTPKEDEDGCLLRQQEAALIRARLAAKKDEYYLNRAR